MLKKHYVEVLVHTELDFSVDVAEPISESKNNSSETKLIDYLNYGIRKWRNLIKTFWGILV